jgi:hypothetical protein
VKLGTFEIGGKKRLGVFENKWAIDLNVSYRTFLTEKRMSDPEASADFQLLIDLISFVKKNEIALSAAKKSSIMSGRRITR